MSGKKHDYSTCYVKFLNKWRKIVEQSPEAAGRLFDLVKNTGWVGRWQVLRNVAGHAMWGS